LMFVDTSSEGVMSLPTGVFKTTLGLKAVIAVTGILLVGFVLVHLLGNLQVYVGAEAMNNYAAMLKGMPGPLWAARFGLLAMFGLHIWANLKLRARNQAARASKYEVDKPIDATWASRSMLLTGLTLLAFVLYHLAHFTLGWTDPQNYKLVDSAGRHDVYSMLVLGFQKPLVAGLYVIAMGFLGAHLYHGIASAFQTMGLRRLTLREAIDAAGHGLALLLVVGNISIPLACLVGLLQPSQGVF